MRRRPAGFGLIEALLALALGLMVLAAASQLFGSAYQAWRLQGATARLQDDARLVLQRLAEDIRMAGMFGCLRLDAADFRIAGAAEAFASPITIKPGSLTLVGAELPGLAGRADWTVLSDCRTWAEVAGHRHVPGTTVQALPIRRLTYRLHKGSLQLLTNSQNANLIDNVRAFEVNLVEVAEGELLDIRLTLFDRQHQLEHRHQLSVALRNPRQG